MNQTFGIVLPVFGLIGIGYAIAWTGMFEEAVGEALGDFVFAIAMPVLIFRTIATADFSGASPWRLWLPFFLGYAIVWAVGHVMVRKVFGRDARAGLVGGISGAYGNVVMVGIPMSIAAYGDRGAAAIALIVAVHLPVMMAASAILIGRVERLDGIATAEIDRRQALRSAAHNVVRNPIVIGIALGGLWWLVGIPLAGLTRTLVDRIADVATTLALLAMGMSLGKYGMHRNVPAGLALSVLKLVALPALVFLLCRTLVAMPPVWAKVAVIAAACPTGVNAYVVASRFRTGEALSSNAITLTTALAVVTVAVWLHVLAGM